MRIIFFVLLLDVVYGLRILGIFPHMGASHFRFFHPIMKRLSQVGHQVTVISHFSEAEPTSNYRDLIIKGGEELSINLEVNNVHNWLGARNYYHYNHWL